jgi:protein-S-isoprenylcysteine O-methyltransferase Ste14
VAEGRPGLGRQLRAIGPLPFVATVVVPFVLCLAWGADLGWGLPGIGTAAAVLAGAIAVIAGVALVWRTVSLFGSVGEGTLAPWDPTRRLVVRGPYRNVRNPMITGVALVLAGETLVLGSPAILAELGIFALLNGLYIPLVEEPGLIRRFGDEYVAYRAAVPRWVPRRNPWTPGRGG